MAGVQRKNQAPASLTVRLTKRRAVKHLKMVNKFRINLGNGVTSLLRHTVLNQKRDSRPIKRLDAFVSALMTRITDHRYYFPPGRRPPSEFPGNERINPGAAVDTPRKMMDIGARRRRRGDSRRQTKFECLHNGVAKSEISSDATISVKNFS